MAVELLADDIRSCLILLVSRRLVPPKEFVANSVIVERVVLGVPALDSSIVGNDTIINLVLIPGRECSALVLADGNDRLDPCVNGSLAVAEAFLNAALDVGIGHSICPRGSGRFCHGHCASSDSKKELGHCERLLF